MPITYRALTEADFEPLSGHGETWLQFSKHLEERLAELDDFRTGDLKDENWSGDAAEAGRERIKEFVQDLDERAAQARRVAAAIDDAAVAYQNCKANLESLIADLDPELKVSVSADGTVTALEPGKDNTVSWLQGEIQGWLDKATEADEALKAAIGLYGETLSAADEAVLDQLAANEVGSLQELIDDDASPEEVNEWWNSLSGAEQIAMLENHPELLGGLDGVPTDTRDYANRELLEAELNRYSPTLDSDIAEIEAQLEAMGDPDQWEMSSAGLWMEESEEYKQYQALQEELAALEDQRDRRDSLTGLQDAITGQASTGQDYYLINYDSAEDGKAIVSVGNPDSADNTAVYVPGTGADLSGFGNEVDRAEQLALASQTASPDQETAVIAWLDYDAPDDVKPSEQDGDWSTGAEDSSYAEAAGPALSQFTHGLEATSPGDSHTTMVSHSYGTTVVGHTASEYGVEADKIIAVASPGMDTPHASGLGIGAENVYVTTAEDDAIRLTTDTYTEINAGINPVNILTGQSGYDGDGDGSQAWHGGVNPVHDDFGAVEFASESLDSKGNETTDGVDIHGGYFIPDNVALENMSYIITDQPDRLQPLEEE
jgi:pimeloyl-ACP methyl ester carboxylesterase